MFQEMKSLWNWVNIKNIDFRDIDKSEMPQVIKTHNSTNRLANAAFAFGS